MESQVSLLLLSSSYNRLRLQIFVVLTLTLQKSRVLHIQGVKGEAVIVYCEPLTTKEMQCPRLSRRVNSTAILGSCSNSQIVKSFNACRNVRKP